MNYLMKSFACIALLVIAQDLCADTMATFTLIKDNNTNDHVVLKTLVGIPAGYSNTTNRSFIKNVINESGKQLTIVPDTATYGEIVNFETLKTNNGILVKVVTSNSDLLAMDKVDFGEGIFIETPKIKTSSSEQSIYLEDISKEHVLPKVGAYKIKVSFKDI